jgi:hypothetical protein
MGPLELDARRDEQVAEPVPAAGRLDHRLVRAREALEVVAQDVPVIRQGDLGHLLARRRERRDHGRGLVLIDAGVEHGTLQVGIAAC